MTDRSIVFVNCCADPDQFHLRYFCISIVTSGTAFIVGRPSSGSPSGRQRNCSSAVAYLYGAESRDEEDTGIKFLPCDRQNSLASRYSWALTSPPDRVKKPPGLPTIYVSLPIGTMSAVPVVVVHADSNTHKEPANIVFFISSLPYVITHACSDMSIYWQASPDVYRRNLPQLFNIDQA